MTGTAASRARPWLGPTVAVSVVAMLIVPMVLPIATSSDSEIGIALAIALVGLLAGLLVAKRSDHPISWLLTAAALAGGIAGLSAEALPPGLTEIAAWQMALAIVSGPAWYGLLSWSWSFASGGREWWRGSS